MSKTIEVTAIQTFAVTPGEYVEPGTSAAVSPQDAKRLFDEGAAERTAAAGPRDPEKVEKPAGDALTEAIAAAVPGVLDDEENLTSTGKPNTLSLEKVLGYDISAQERDAGWALHKERQKAAGGGKQGQLAT